MNSEEKLNERLGHLEQSAASTSSDLRSLFNAIEGLANEVKSLVNRRPNMGIVIMASLTALGLIATMSTLAMSPVYRTLGTQSEAILRNGQLLEERGWMLGTQIAKTESLTENYDDLLTRIYRLENLAINQREN